MPEANAVFVRCGGEKIVNLSVDVLGAFCVRLAADLKCTKR